jgi:hypothetical protein
MDVRTGDRVDVCRAVCRAVCADDCMGNCRAVVEPSVETFVETIMRLPSILVLRVSGALELRIGL